MVNNRFSGLDLIRALAIFSVIGGHFFLNSGFQQAEFAGVSMFVQGCAKFFFGIGVPLFLMLTGYLQGKKEATLKYYKGALRVLGSYAVFCLVTILFRIYYLGEQGSVLQWGHKVLDFSAIPYGWYIEMWIGLFLLVPFLNILWRHIPTQRLKLVLLGTLYLMTALPDMTNRYGMHLTPGFWTDCYPLFFFFVGAYIRENGLTLRKSYLLGGVCLICLINPVFNTLFVRGHSMIQVAGGPWGIFGAPLAVAVFALLYRWDTRLEWLRTALGSISKLSLDMYLCCWIFDALWYPIFKERWYESQGQFGVFFFAIVPLLFACSYSTAWLKVKLLRF